MPDFNIKAYYQNLARHFRNGPTVPQRVANKSAGPGEFVGSPIGTAAAYLRDSTNSFASHMAHYGNYSRLSRYADYAEMETMAEVASALDIYSHEVCAKGEYGEILKIDSNNPEIKEALIKLFYDTLNIEFNLAPWARSLCKYGDYLLLVDHHPDYGVVNVFPLPVNEIEREEGFDPENPMRYRYRWISHGNKILEPWQVIHFRLLGNDSYLPYGMSILEAARRAWRQLILMEDAVMVYRIVRSPERRVFYIDVGNVAPNDVGQVMEKTRNNMKRNQVVDPSTGQVDLRYNALSVDEDYFIGVRGQDSGTKIDTLPGGNYTGDIEDLHYIQNKLFAALKIPKSYLGYEGDISGKSTLAQEDVRFARTVQHIQRVIIAELEKIAMIHLYSMGLRDEDITDFELSMANPSTINEIQRLELWRTRFEVASLATGQEGVLDKTFLYRHIFKLSDQEIEAIEAGRIRDKQLQVELDSMQLRAEAEIENDIALQQQGQDTELGELPADDGDLDADEMTDGPTGSGSMDQVGEAVHPNQQRGAPNDMLGRAKKKKRSRPDPRKQVYNMKKNGMDPLKDLQLMRRAGTSPWAEQDEKSESEAIHEKRIAKLGAYTRIIKAMENFRMGQRKKKLL